MTLAEKAYEALRHDIIRGELAPGRPLRLADLSKPDAKDNDLQDFAEDAQFKRLVR